MSNYISNLTIEKHYQIQFKLVHHIFIHTNHSKFAIPKINNILKCSQFIKHLN